MFATHLILAIKMFSLFVLAFGVALLAEPLLSHFLYRFRAWKKHPRERTFSGEATPIFRKLHGEKEVKTPRMGGILIWGTVLLITGITFVAGKFFPDSYIGSLDFVSRSETWLPLFAFASASLLGLIDDVLVVRNKGRYIGGGLRLFGVRLPIIFLIALVGAWWFYVKLERSSVFVPFFGDVELGVWYMVFFVITVFATYSSSIVDGLDGLSAGVLMPVFAAFGVIAYTVQLYDLTAFIVLLLGALLTYLWFNVHPAKFYMGETGIMGLTVVLAVIALLTDWILLLPIIGFVLVMETASDIIQITAKRFFGRKVFLSAPIHHHFEAKGWPESKVTMRFWIISTLFSAMGLVLFFLSRFF